MISEPSDYTTDFSDHTDEHTVTSGFREENICGVGATCTVYAMRLGGLRVAVKRLKNGYISDPRYVAAYRKEYQIGQRLKHDALPLYRDFKSIINDVYIVMDFIDGVVLSDYLRTANGKQYFSNPANVRRFLSQMISGLTYLHHCGVIHCDVKPANIMLRHSDRAAMLIDLDKAYCDTLDTTQGGTRNISDPLPAGDRPTIDKDFAALGKVLELIADNVPQFPRRQFKRFQRECLSKNVTDESLIKALGKRSKTPLWIGLSLVIIALTAIGFFIFRPTSYTESDDLHAIDQAVETSDSIPTVNPVKEEEVAPEVIVVQTPAAKSKDIIGDFDSQMADFIREVEDAFEILLSGNVPDSRIRELMYAIQKSYLSKYHDLMTNHKSKNPDMSGIDVELELARKAEKSKANRLFEQFMQAVADTITARHPENDF
ncbi:MAG: protein kinase [Paramuribaculum sp.]|nr:protein kinase [Paramuribaculum sp.]